MAKRDFSSKHAIKRNAIREDLLFFGIPALLVFFVGLVLSARDGYDGLVGTMWALVRQPQKIYLLSLQNMIGLALFVAGLTIALISVATLGRFYSSTLVTRQDHRLITHGLYSYARHPIYFGVILACFGPPVYAASTYGLLVMLGLIPIFLSRIRIEERLLTEEFGEDYQMYARTTSKLIPYIY